MAFDTPPNGAPHNSEALRHVLQEAIGASQAATGRLLAALAMRTSPTMCAPALKLAMEEVMRQAKALERAGDILSGAQR